MLGVHEIGLPTSRHGNITHRELVVSGSAGGLEQHRRSSASQKYAVRDCCRGVENSQGTARAGGRESIVTDEHGVYQSEVPGAFLFATAANQHGSEVLLTNTFRRGSREREYSSGGKVNSESGSSRGR